FCREVGAKFAPAPQEIARLFEPRLVEASYLVEEYAFDTSLLALWARSSLESSGVEVRLKSKVEAIKAGDTGYRVKVVDEAGVEGHVLTRYFFNCTYSGLNQIGGDFPRVQTDLKHEITEMA